LARISIRTRKSSQSRLGILVFGLCALGLLASCSQSSGDTCQINSDCSSGLICCKGETDRGVCDTASSCNSGALSDGGSDAATPDAALMSTDDSGESDGG
jgi:hypothetical protein